MWIAEFKVYDASLINIQHFETNLCPEVKEFMKGRYYYLANRIQLNWLGCPYDYGVVDTNMGHIATGKGDGGPAFQYQEFKLRSLSFRDPRTGKKYSD